ncbi:hypothetical protein GCM10010911_20130 [Paenibacillus nasutitermitis]|uniref:F5/8 type C domain-containing protein n=1 Tax=Paenibacillus nasutitermitis TaxID=1652958 RepID=A0A917DSE3_9BACL|nr:hypothetical protein GCM10010911_20130 [Paenibacillus nasutitermitis]
MDEGSGTSAAGASGNNNNGTLNNGAGWTAGKIGSAVSLDGVNDYVSIPDSGTLDGMSTLTVSAWINLDQLPTNNYDVVGKNANGNSYRLAVSLTGNSSFVVKTTNNDWYTAGTAANSSTALSPGTWHHLVGTYDGSYVRIYVDGVLQGTGAQAISGSIHNSAASLKFGYSSGANIDYTKGKVDEIQIYDTALDAAGVRSLYQSYVTVWQPIELTFAASASYTNPYKDVDLSATFTGPNLESMTIPGYWDGGNVWKIRFSPTSAGTWTYTTSSTNSDDTGLHNQSGTLRAGAYTGNLDIYKKGFLKKSGNNRYLTYNDGSPFFWLGDTHWFGLSRESWSSSNDSRWSSQFKGMIDKRSEDGFTVYQTSLFVGELGDAGGYGTSNEGGYVWGFEGYPIGASTVDTTGYYKTANKAFDSNVNTKWAAKDNTFPQKLYIDLKQNTTLSKVDTYFDYSDIWNYKIEGSTDGVNYTVLANNVSGKSGQQVTDTTNATARYVRITITGNSLNSAAAIKEFKVYDSSNNLMNNDHKWDLPNVAFWQDVDRRLKYIADKGMVTALGLDWGRELEPVLENDFKRMSRYVVARYGAYAMTWIHAGEYAYGDDQTWGDIAAYTRSIDPYRQIATLHNTADNPNLFRNETWYDIDFLQGAHDARREISFWKERYDLTPTVPVLESEIDYESILGIPEYYTREDAYRSFMAGSFGFTYGAEGIWNDVKNWNDSFQTWGKSPRPWYSGIDLPSGSQLKYYKDFLLGIDWPSLAPSTTAITWGSGAPASGIRQPYQKSNAARTLVVAYLPSWGGQYTGTVNSLPTGNTYTAKWFNTQNGKYTTISSNFSPSGNGTWSIPAQPDGSYDWALLLYATTNRVNQPVASVAGGTFASAQSITLSSSTSGSTVYYTTDGTAPTVNSTPYTGAFTISAKRTLKAIAVKSGMTQSIVTTEYYNFSSGTVAMPSADVVSGSYGGSQAVTLTSATSGASIYYTTNGTPPSTASTLYIGTITIDKTSMLRAIAVKSGYTNSEAMEKQYRIRSKDLISKWKDVKASSRLSGNEEDYAVDGDLQTWWSPNSSQNEWIEVDLGRHYDISLINLRFKSAAPYFYRIDVSGDRSTYTTVVDKSATNTLSNGTAHDYPIAATKVRYVKLTIIDIYEAKSDGKFAFPEISVYGNNVNLLQELAFGSETNLVYGKPIKASSYLNNSYGGRNAGDNNTVTSWQAATGQFAGEWIEVNFEENKTFNVAKLMEYGNRTSGYRIEYWNGSAWQTAYTGTTIGTANQFKTVRFPAVTGSKARLYFTSGTSQPIIYEFQLFSKTDQTSASSQFSESHISSNAFDGNRSSAWQAAVGSYAGEWIERDLGVNITFNTAQLSEYANRTSGYRIEYWNGSSWLTAYTGTTIGDISTVSFPSVTGSKARLYFTGGSQQPAIYEFEVYNRTYTASSIYNGDNTYAASKAFDDNAGSAWQAASGQFANQWLEVDMGRDTIFSQVQISEWGNRTTGYRIEYWDGAGWQTAYTGTTIGSGSTVEFASVVGSKARIYFTSGSQQPSIYEFKVLAESRDLSLNITASASSFSNVNHTAAKAVDRNTGTYWSASSGTFPQWLKLDLGQSRYITSMKQTFNNNTTWKFNIEVSDDDLNYATWVDNTSTGDAGTNFNYNFEVKARYVKLTVTQSSSGDWVTSNEFVVSGR